MGYSARLTVILRRDHGMRQPGRRHGVLPDRYLALAPGSVSACGHARLGVHPGSDLLRSERNPTRRLRADDGAAHLGHRVCAARLARRDADRHQERGEVSWPGLDQVMALAADWRICRGDAAGEVDMAADPGASPGPRYSAAGRANLVAPGAQLPSRL